MTRKILATFLTFALGIVVGRLALPATHLPFSTPGVVNAQTLKPATIFHLYTGSDNQTHVEEIPANFTGGVYKMLPITGAELHSAAPGGFIDWHPAPRRQYIITLKGQAELEVSGGKKIQVSPGQIELVEDVTGKGHITRSVGTEDRVAIWLPVADNAPAIATQDR